MIVRIIILLTCITVACSTGSKTEKEPGDELMSQIKIKDLEGNVINLNDYKGKTIFLNFWATWCKPCIQEMPSIERLMGQLKDENIVFLFASDEPAERIKQFEEKRPWDFQYVQLNMAFADLNLYSIPVTYIFDENGELAMGQTGAEEWDRPESVDQLKSIIYGDYKE